MPNLLVIGIPENRRIALLREASCDTEWSIEIASYLDLLTGQLDLCEIATRADVIRIESPGECFGLEKELLSRGAFAAFAEGCAAIDPERARQLEEELGRIRYPRQYYLGFADLLMAWRQQLPDVIWMTNPLEIVCMCDKELTATRLSEVGLPIPEPIGTIHGYDHLASEMTRREWRRVFVKLANGSSASGVAAIYQRGSTTWALSTVELVESSRELRLYNSLKIHRYQGADEVRKLIDALVPNRLYAERWRPKASMGHSEVFDLRVVVIGGQPTHFVVRVSRSPFTNLHLGNRRGDWAALRQRMGIADIERLENLSRQVAVAFPNAHYAGLDIILSPGFHDMRFLEVNAFGDLLPGVLDDRGLDAYGRELRSL